MCQIYYWPNLWARSSPIIMPSPAELPGWIFNASLGHDVPSDLALVQPKAFFFYYFIVVTKGETQSLNSTSPSL